MSTAEGEIELCAERLCGLGWQARTITRRMGPFAAAVFDVWASTNGGSIERFVYKRPPPERTGELEVIGALGNELSPWLPDGLIRFAEEPPGILSRYAGEPALPTGAERSLSKRQRAAAYGRISALLADMHLRTFPDVPRWMSEGKAAPYEYSRAWANRMLEEASGAFPPNMEGALSELTDRFYHVYGARAMQAPAAFTHGDPHGGNVLALNGKLTLIDWEWTNIASPMRDAAILGMDEADEELYAQIGRGHATRLLQGGFPSNIEALMSDYDWMTVDNALLSMGWDAQLLRRGDVSTQRFRELALRRLKRMLPSWERIQRRMEGQS